MVVALLAHFWFDFRRTSAAGGRAVPEVREPVLREPARVVARAPRPPRRRDADVRHAGGVRDRCRPARGLHRRPLQPGTLKDSSVYYIYIYITRQGLHQ